MSGHGAEKYSDLHPRVIFLQTTQPVSETLIAFLLQSKYSPETAILNYLSLKSDQQRISGKAEQRNLALRLV